MDNGSHGVHERRTSRRVLGVLFSYKGSFVVSGTAKLSSEGVKLYLFHVLLKRQKNQGGVVLTRSSPFWMV